jgi:hypothetical protein
LREQGVCRFVRAVVGIALQKMSDLVRSNECWSFSIAFDGAAVQGRSLLDIRLRLLEGGRIENLHLLAIPLRESHTCLGMAKPVHSFTKVLCGESWKSKLFGICTDGAGNMTGRESGAVTHLASGAFPRFFRVWCAAHQLHLVIQDVMSALCDESIYTKLTALIGHLHRQQNLIVSMRSTPDGFFYEVAVYHLVEFAAGLRSTAPVCSSILRRRIRRASRRCRGGWCLLSVSDSLDFVK